MNARENEWKGSTRTNLEFFPTLGTWNRGGKTESREQSRTQHRNSKRSTQMPGPITLPPISMNVPITVCSPQWSSATVYGSAFTCQRLVSADSWNWLLGIFNLSDCSVDLVFLLSNSLPRGGTRMDWAFLSKCWNSSHVYPAPRLGLLLLEEEDVFSIFFAPRCLTLAWNEWY